MIVSIPDDLNESLAVAAQSFRISPEEAVQRATLNFIEEQKRLQEELQAWL